MSRTTILEVRGRTAGLVVGTDAGFRFFSSQPAFDALDGSVFPSIAATQRAANLLARHGLSQLGSRGRTA